MTSIGQWRGGADPVKPRKRRSIDQWEQLVLDAVDRMRGPTARDIRAYIGLRRRVGFWAATTIWVAMIRLEERKVIEARRMADHEYGYVWVYVRVAEPQPAA